MHQLITFDQMVYPFGRDPGLTNEIRANCVQTVLMVNDVCLRAQADGCILNDDPDTVCAISGSPGNHGGGGWVPSSYVRAAAHSQHYQGNAIDRTDVGNNLARWCLMHKKELEEIGLYLEHPQWTPTWVHFQRIPPGSHNRWFLPYADMVKYPPRIPPLVEQGIVGVQQFRVAVH